MQWVITVKHNTGKIDIQSKNYDKKIGIMNRLTGTKNFMQSNNKLELISQHVHKLKFWYPVVGLQDLDKIWLNKVMVKFFVLIMQETA